MINAYDKLYVEKSRNSMACMFDFVVYDLKYDLEYYFECFLHSDVSKRFENGDVSVVAGKSGVEMVYDVMYQMTGEYCDIKPNYSMKRSEEYWLGWALAYYQWYTNVSFAEIVKYIPLHYMLQLYHPYHEMDIQHFIDKMNDLYLERKSDTNLKIMRMKCELSQKQLAEVSGVSLRTIQQYEQRQKDINKASAITLLRFAKSLNCEIEELIEKI